jgi:N-acetylmuramoyl-L-alanine amidase
VRAFQVARGLEANGICDRQTWTAIVEAGYQLGDRLLYLRRPMQRGDDVAELQGRLGMLGFDPGRIDGIFGPTTARALTEFQANAGLPSDGIAGHESVALLDRLAGRGGSTRGVSEVREREALRHAPRTLAGRRLALGEPGGLEVLVRGVHRALALAGAEVVVLQHPDGSTLAAGANAADAELYLDLALDDERCHGAYYAATGFESPGGKRLASILDELVPPVLGQPQGVSVGMRLAVLRETRMPAVHYAIGPPHDAIPLLPELALAVSRAITRWCQQPPNVA